MKTTTKTRLNWCWGDLWGGDDTGKSTDPESAHDKVEQVRLLGKGLSYLTWQESPLSSIQVVSLSWPTRLLRNDGGIMFNYYKKYI